MACVKPLTVSVVLLLALCAAAGGEEPPGREAALPESEVKDFFFAYFLGLLVGDLHTALEAEDLRALAPEYEADPEFPFHRIVKVERKPVAGSEHEEIRIDFKDHLKFDLPFDILGYHPGSVSVSRTLRVRETHVSTRCINAGTRREARLDLLWILELWQGSVFFDFDAWLDALAAGLLDDMRVRRLYVFRFDGSWYGVLEGVGHGGRIITGTYNFRENRIVVPPPRELRSFSDNFLNVPAGGGSRPQLTEPQPTLPARHQSLQ